MFTSTERKGGRKPGQWTRPPMHDRQVKYLKPGTWRVAPRLWVQVTPGGSRSFFHEWMRNGERARMGLGSYPGVSLAMAKAKVDANMRIIAHGGDPRETGKHTFTEAFEAWYEAHSPEWKSARYKKSVRREVEDFALDILGDLPVSRIKTAHVREVLWQDDDGDQPFWLVKNPTAFRLKGYINEIMGFAMAMDWRAKGSGNPAAWVDNLAFLLPSPGNIHEPEPHPALPYAKATAFMRALATLTEDKHRALELLILTATRSQEARGADASEFDLQAGLWTVPGRRMKKRRNHVVPLSWQAVDLLKRQPRQGKLFADVSDKSLLEAIADVAAIIGPLQDAVTGKDIVVHGFRSTFSSWSGSEGDYDETMVKFCLSHRLADETFRRYMRDDMLVKRRTHMQRWADAILPA